MSAQDLIEPEIRELIEMDALPAAMTSALEELKSLQVIDINGRTVGVRPKNLPNWSGMVTALQDADCRAAFELAFKAAEPSHWRLIHLVALEIFPALARRPVGPEVST